MGAELAEFAELASSGATTFVGLVVTDAWQQAKERIGRLLARGGDSRLEAARLEVTRTELLLADESGDRAARTRIQQDWEARLRDVLGRDPSAVAELRSVLDEFDPQRGRPPQPGGVHHGEHQEIHNSVDGVVHGGAYQIGQVHGGVTIHAAPAAPVPPGPPVAPVPSEDGP